MTCYSCQQTKNKKPNLFPLQVLFSDIIVRTVSSLPQFLISHASPAMTNFMRITVSLFSLDRAVSITSLSLVYCNVHQCGHAFDIALPSGLAQDKLLPETTANDILPAIQVAWMSIADKVIPKSEWENPTSLYSPGVQKVNNKLNSCLLPLYDIQSALLWRNHLTLPTGRICRACLGSGSGSCRSKGWLDQNRRQLEQNSWWLDQNRRYSRCEVRHLCLPRVPTPLLSTANKSFCHKPQWIGHLRQHGVGSIGVIL